MRQVERLFRWRHGEESFKNDLPQHADVTLHRKSAGRRREYNARMIEIDIPRFGPGKISIKRIVTDYTRTLSCGGELTPGVKGRLRRLRKLVEIHVVTSDSFGTAAKELSVIPLDPHILATREHDEEKRQYVSAHEPQLIAAFGNGRNDALMLKAVKDAGGLAIAVDNGEGCAVEAVQNAHILIVGIVNALDLLLEPTRCKATLRT